MPQSCNSNINDTKVGIIHKVSVDSVEVLLERNSACKECHIKGHCLSSDEGTILIEVETPYTNSFRVGDKVIVRPQFSVLHAVLYAFVIPIVLLLLSLILGNIYHLKEIELFYVGISCMGIYFFVLKGFNSYFKKKYKYSLEKF